MPNRNEHYVSRDHPVRAEAISHHAQRSKTYGDDRACRECDKPLTRYNPGPNCYAHTDRLFPGPLRGERKRA